MNSGRRISAAVLAAVLSMGAIGLSAGPAEAMKDTTWPTRSSDTTWPTLTDTTWPTLTAPMAPTDTTWPTR